MPQPLPSLFSWIIPGLGRSSIASPLLDLLLLAPLPIVSVSLGWSGNEAWWVDALLVGPGPLWLLWWSMQGLRAILRDERLSGPLQAYASSLFAGALAGYPLTIMGLVLSGSGSGPDFQDPLSSAAAWTWLMMIAMAAAPLTAGIVFPFPLIAALPILPAMARTKEPPSKAAPVLWWTATALSALVAWPLLGVVGAVVGFVA